MTNEDIVRIGKEVLEIESEAVKALAGSLDENFARAVVLLSKAESRVIVTGIGKSGLVARKIAATLASCGTPSLFVHPVEAGHGDLGMIVEKDIMIVLSYSGNTREVVDLLEFVKRFGIKLIGITGNKKSQLAHYSDVVLEAKVSREAEASGLIPTASTTAALALGDALAITLMKMKGINQDDFAIFHPKGQAGKKLTKISHLMHKAGQIPQVSTATTMQKVLQEMSEKHLGMTCVVDKDQKLLGIITDGDLRRLLQKHGEALFQLTAEECMIPDPLAINKDALATKGLKLMEDNKVTSLIIKTSQGKVAGIIHLHDLWRTGMF
ncbi:MAG: KpsF/GutQ family sugar-phosphate isomerase [Candidatus Aminicenantes bacterium]|nr:KpsF/GutQ family sugar-phosphate isomerase [Candidatus Aminicenantes bacterium]